MRSNIVLLLCILGLDLAAGCSHNTGKRKVFRISSSKELAKKAKKVSKVGPKAIHKIPRPSNNREKQPQRQGKMTEVKRKGRSKRLQAGFGQLAKGPFKVTAMGPMQFSPPGSDPALSAGPMAVEQLQEPHGIAETYRPDFSPLQLLDWMKKADEHGETKLLAKLQDIENNVEESIVYILHCDNETMQDIDKLVPCKIGATERSIKERLLSIFDDKERCHVIVERKIITPFRQTFEQAMHASFAGYRMPKRTEDVLDKKTGKIVKRTINGGTEWFRLSLKMIDERIKKIADILSKLYPRIKFEVIDKPERVKCPMLSEESTQEPQSAKK